jgi:hypothetical protein
MKILNLPFLLTTLLVCSRSIALEDASIDLPESFNNTLDFMNNFDFEAESESSLLANRLQGIVFASEEEDEGEEGNEGQIKIP